MEVTSLEQKIARNIQNSGFPVEVTTGSAFSKASWLVIHQMVYRDLEEAKTRAIDVLAIKNLTLRAATYKEFNFWTIIECKKSDKPWVFYAPTNDVLDDKNRAISNYLKIASNPPLDIRQSSVVQNTHYVTKEPLDRLAQAHYIAFADQKSKSEGLDQIWTALNQASKAAYFFLTEITDDIKKQRSNEVHIFYPIIVLDGIMFLYNLDRDDNTIVKQTQYVKFNHQVLTAKSEPEFFLIDIVTKNFLPTYIQWLDAEASSVTGPST